MSAGRRNGLSAAESNAERVNVRCSKRSAARSTASRTVVGGSASSPAASSEGLPPASARTVLRRAIALGALALLLDLTEQVLAVRPDGFELAEQRLVRREPVVRRLAGGGLGRRVLRLLAALG